MVTAMANNKTAGWILFIAALGVMCGLLADDVSALKSWHEATTPSFFGSILAHLGAVIGAFVGGRVIPTEVK